MTSAHNTVDNESVEDQSTEPNGSWITPKLLAQNEWTSSDSFPRRAIWCPDGQSLLCQNEDRTINILEVPNEERPHIKQTSIVKCPAALLTTAWYPGAQTYSPATYCYLRSVRDTPLALLDGKSGKIRASYPIISHTERFLGPHSLAFSADASKIYCGHENAIEIFDFSRDGEAGTRISTTPNRKSREGQKGIISDLAISPSMPSVLAAASFSRNVALYDISSPDEAACMQVFTATGAGTTQVYTKVKFHPSEPRLFVASRRSNAIKCFDIRQAATLLCEYARPAQTNQRLFFDIDYAGNYLVAGDQFGSVHVYNLSDSNSTHAIAGWTAHSEAIGSVQFSPVTASLLIAHGSRHFNQNDNSLDSEASSEASDESENAVVHLTPDRETHMHPSGVSIWNLG